MTQLPRRRQLVGAATIALIAITAVGCNAGSDSGPDSESGSSPRITSSDSGADTGAAPVPLEVPADAETFNKGADADQLARSYDATERGNVSSLPDSASSARNAEDIGSPERKLISNGNVALQSDDVAKTQFDVVSVSDKYAGEVESKESQTDKEGEVIRSRMVLRIPTAQFINAMDDLSGTAQLLNNNSSTADVTTEVLDKDIRIEIQRDSIDRIALLLDRAQNIRDIVNIEAQLSRRQADLATLEQKQRYLADQTAMSTVSVSIQQRPEEKKKEPEKRATAGFFVGLSDGWKTLKGAATDVSTAVGALVPFALVGGIVGFPLWAALRRRRRTTSADTAG